MFLKRHSLTRTMSRMRNGDAGVKAEDNALLVATITIVPIMEHSERVQDPSAPGAHQAGVGEEKVINKELVLGWTMLPASVRHLCPDPYLDTGIVERPVDWATSGRIVAALPHGACNFALTLIAEEVRGHVVEPEMHVHIA